MEIGPTGGAAAQAAVTQAAAQTKLASQAVEVESKESPVEKAAEAKKATSANPNVGSKIDVEA